MNSRAKVIVVVSSTFLVLLLVLGSVMGKSASTDSPYHHLAVFTEVLSRIKSEYVEEPDLKSVTLGALNGLLESIDPFASYLNADQYKEYQKNYDTFKGDVGLVLSKRFGYIGVVSAIPGSPAAKAGLTTGDILESIKGVATRDMPLAYAELLLRGLPGTTVDLMVLRRRPEPQKMTLTRALPGPLPVQTKMLANDVGYVRAESLAGGKVKEVAAAIAELEKKGAKRFVLDLRQCATGTPEEGVALADLFLEKGLITYLQGQRVARKDFQADSSKPKFKEPLVILANRGTAGAAEVAAAALQDDKRAELVGERTYGDASQRKAISMDDGGAVILSVAKYYSPAGKAIQDTGATPANLVAEADVALESDDDSDGAKADANEPEHKAGEDLTLKKALELLAK